jgi:hypothetical protein
MNSTFNTSNAWFVFAAYNMGENLMDDCVSTTEMGLDSQELSMGLPFTLSQGLNSQELIDSILTPSNDPMLPMISSQSSLEDGGSRQQLTLTLTQVPMMDCISTPNCNVNTPDLQYTGFSLVDFVNNNVSTI